MTIPKLTPYILFGLIAISPVASAEEPAPGAVFSLGEGKLPVVSLDLDTKVPVAPPGAPAPKTASVSVTSLKLPEAAARGCLPFKVRRGDSLSRISTAFGIPLRKLLAVNHLTNPNLLIAGKKILLPVVGAPITYTVHRDDTLSGIAGALGMRENSIALANHLADPNKLRRGARLIVPRAEKSQATPVKRPSARVSKAVTLAVVKS